MQNRRSSCVFTHTKPLTVRVGRLRRATQTLSSAGWVRDMSRYWWKTPQRGILNNVSAWHANKEVIQMNIRGEMLCWLTPSSPSSAQSKQDTSARTTSWARTLHSAPRTKVFIRSTWSISCNQPITGQHLVWLHNMSSEHCICEQSSHRRLNHNVGAKLTRCVLV